MDSGQGNRWIRMVARRVLKNNEIGEVIDCGGAKQLGVEVQIYTTGGGTVAIQHAAVNEDDAFTQLGSTFSLAGATSVQLNASFLRYVRFVTASVTGSPEASIDLVVKDAGASRMIRMLPRRVVKQAETSEIADLLEYKTICAQIRVPTAGVTTGTIELQHAAVCAPSAFVTLGSAVTLLTAGTNNVQYHTSFLRYLRWRVSDTIGGSPEVIVDIIAKEL